MDRANTIKFWIESMFTDFINPYIASNSRLHSGHLTEFFIFLINENKNIRHLFFIKNALSNSRIICIISNQFDLN